MTGGFSEGKEPSEKEFEMVTKLKWQVEEQLNKQFEFYVPVLL